MELTSEQVRWLGKAAFVVVTLLLLAPETGWLKNRWVFWLLPALLVGYGIESYADLWIHGSVVPHGYAAESRQHLLQGSSLLVAGVVEALLLAGRLRAWLWRLVLPLALAVVGIVFLMHAQHETGVRMELMLVQHRAFAIALLTSAVARAVGSVPRFPVWREAWLLPLLIFGIEMLTYRETVSNMPSANTVEEQFPLQFAPKDLPARA